MAFASILPLQSPLLHQPPTPALRSPFNGVRCTPTATPFMSPVDPPRPAVILPGLGNNSGDYQRLQVTLEEYGVKSLVAKVSRLDWFRNAAGLADPNYWKGTLGPRPVLDWYLKRVDEAVSEAKELAQGTSKLSLVGHSAGGWLARVYMEEFGKSDISLLLTLGTPHLPPPKGVSGVIDQTRGLLNYVQEHCAPAVYTPELKYVCIAGRYIQGVRVLGNSYDLEEASQGAVVVNVSETTPSGGTFRARFVGQGYKQVCGQADVWGDGVVPEVSAHLEGALNISLDGVYHSPVGSDDLLRPWIDELLEERQHQVWSQYQGTLMEKISAACAMGWNIELEKGLRSNKPGHPLESINLIGPRLKQWSRDLQLTRAAYDMYGLVPGEDRLFADAILLRLADAFVSGDKDVKISVLRVLLSIHKHCKSKDRRANGMFSNMSKENRLEFLRRVKVVLTTDNVESRALVFYLFGCCAEIVNDIPEVRLAILSTLLSTHALEVRISLEFANSPTYNVSLVSPDGSLAQLCGHLLGVKASLFAAGCFSEISEDFGSVFLTSLLNLMNSPKTLPVLRFAGARLVSSNMLQAGADLVGKPLEEDVLAAIIMSMTVFCEDGSRVGGDGGSWWLLISDDGRMGGSVDVVEEGLENVGLLSSFLAQKTTPRLQATILRCMLSIGEKAACFLPVSAFPFQNLFSILDEPDIPSSRCCEVLQILHKILVYGFNDMLFSGDFIKLLKHVDDGTRSPIISVRLLAFQILVCISNKLKGNDELMLEVKSVTSPTGVVSTIFNQISLLVNLVSGGIPSSEVEQELGSMLKLLLLMVKNNSELGHCILDKIQFVIKSMVDSENMSSASIRDPEVHKIVDAGAKQKFSMRGLMIPIYRFLVAILESLDESGSITNETVFNLKQVVSFVCENSLFDCSTHTFFALLYSVVNRIHLRTENLSSNSILGLSRSPSTLHEHEALINGCAKNMLAGGDNWVAYKAGRYAACEGEWYVASCFFQHLVTRVQSDNCSQWLKFLFQFTHSEKNVKVLLQQSSCCLPLDQVVAPSTVDSSPTGTISSEYIKKLDDAFDGIFTSDKVLEALSLQTRTFCFQRWFLALRLKVLAVLVDILKLLNGCKADLESKRHDGGSDVTNVEPIFHKMKDTMFSLVEVSAKLARVAEEYDLISSSFVDLDTKSLKLISALALSCSVLACCIECSSLILNSVVSVNLTRESGYCHGVIVKNLAVLLWQVDYETCTDLLSFLKEYRVHERSLHFLPGFQISKVGLISENILTLCRISVKRLSGLRNDFLSVENEAGLLQVYMDIMQLLLSIVKAWMHIPFQLPKYFFRVRPTSGSLLFIQSAGSKKQKEIFVARGSHLALNLCIQLKNVTSDVCSRFSKIHCILNCKSSFLGTRGNQKPCGEGWTDYQPSETGNVIELNKKLRCHIMKHTREFMKCEDPQNDGETVVTYACFETNGGAQGFSTCLLDVSTFPVGSYRIHWHSGGIDHQGSYWSFLPLSPCPQFSVIDASEKL
ncbi:Integrator complex subunit 7 [Bienertia sinuspersici]